MSRGISVTGACSADGVFILLQSTITIRFQHNTGSVDVLKPVSAKVMKALKIRAKP